jgi:hypothetical protein
MALYPYLRPLPPQRVEMPEELAMGVELACYPKTAHDVIGANRVNEHALRIVLAELSVIDR